MKKKFNFLFCILLIIISTSIGNSQTWLWVKNISGTDTVSDKAVACDQSNNVYVTGTFMGTANFDGTHSLTANTGCTDFFIAKYDQSGNLIWVMQGATTTASGSKNNFGRNIVFDGSGNLYITGYNSQTATFNNGINIIPHTTGISSGFILKVSNSGNALASIVYAYGSAISSESIAMDQSGDLIISGNYTGSLTLYGSSNSYPVSTSKNHYIVQYTNSFGFNWANVFTGSTTTTKLISISTCTNQGFYVGGFFKGSLTIGVTTLYSKSSTSEDIVLIKIDNSGSVLWIRQAGSLNADRCNEVKADNSGNAYLTGYINGATINFDSTGTGNFDSRGFSSLGGYDCIVAKYNPQGKFLWAKVFGNAYYQIGYGISTIDSNVAVTGTSAGNMSWNNTLSSGIYNEDVFVGLLDKNCTPLYSSKAGGSNNVEDRGERITFDNNKNIYISGFYYSNPLIFGTDTIIPGGTKPNVFLAKYQTIFISPVITNDTCYSGNNGAISITVSGGTNPFSYIWSNAATTQNISNLTAGTYTVTATDANSAKAISSFIVTQPAGNIAANSANSSPSQICIGSSSTLSLSGGSLAPGASWYWYSGSCGGTSAGIGTSITVTPSTTSTYYVRAEGTCNTTTCVSATITLNAFSFSASSASASPTVVCPGSSSILTISGGTLGTGATWEWYTVSCGGTSSGNGISITVSPSSATTYFVRAEGFCGSSTCVSTIVTLNQLSTPATSASSSPSLICSGSSTTLSFTGGSLGTGASWKWWSGSCGGISRGVGLTLSVSPTVTTTYYLRAQGTCNTSTCVSTKVIVNSTAATSASASPATIAAGSSSTLTESGGTLGLNSNWYWYSGSCGGFLVGNGSSIIVSPTVSTLYYVRDEGTCNTTTCVSRTVLVCTNSSPANSASCSPALICSGSSTTLSFTGGSSGVGAIWRWYSASCGGISRGTGTSLVLAPTITTTYYVRAQGLCNTTTCVSTIVIVNSTAATSATASPNSVVPGYPSTLTLTGGVLGLNASWYWYSVSCGGTFAGTGTTIVQNPASDITYYVRAESTCNTTTCVSVTITVCSNSTPTGSASASPSTLCNGYSTTLTLSGGSLGNTEIWKWYSVSCGGISRGTGDTLVLAPTVTTVYYVRAQGICNTTICVSTTVIVNSSPAASASATPSVITSGASTTLKENSGVLGISSAWYWYSSSCGGTFIGTGASIIKNPTVSTTYYVRSENSSCSQSSCVSVFVTVNSAKVLQYNNITENNKNSLNNELIIYPNPANDVIYIKYNIIKNGFIKISLFNILGEKVIDIINDYQITGTFYNNVNLSDLSSGIYICKMVLNGEIIKNTKFVISK